MYKESQVINTSKYKDNGFYAIYDCFNKADKDCKTRDIWLAAFEFCIKNFVLN
jgi:hypothetical protein